MTDRERYEAGGFPAGLPSRRADKMTGDAVIRLYSTECVGLWSSKPVLAFVMNNDDELELGVVDAVQQRTGRGHAQRQQQNARGSAHHSHWHPQPVPHYGKNSA